MKKKREKKILITLKMISILCIIILVFEIGYLIHRKYFNTGESIYFDSINAISYINNNFVSVGSNNNNENHYEKAKLSFYDDKRHKVYEKIYSKGYNSAFFDVDVSDNTYVAVGSYEASHNDHINGTRKALIVAYDNDGNVIFDKDFGVLENSKFMSVKIVDDGYLVVGQSIYEAMTVGFSSEGGAFLIKYDKNGKIKWKTNYGESKSAIFNDLYILDDYIYVVGSDYGKVGIILKYDLNGNLLKKTEYQYTDSFGFTGIAVNGESIFVSGGKRIIGEEDSGRIDGLIVKYDFDCNYLDEVSYDEDMQERFNKILMLDDDNLLIIGSMSSYDKDKTVKDVNVLKYDGVIAKYREDLKLIKAVSYGEDRDDHFTDMIVLDNSYLVTGYSSYEDKSYMSKFIIYSDALKVLEVE